MEISFQWHFKGKERFPHLHLVLTLPHLFLVFFHFSACIHFHEFSLSHGGEYFLTIMLSQGIEILTFFFSENAPTPLSLTGLTLTGA